MSQGYKLSVITITYNDYEGLKKTLDSLPSQENLESIVINGGDCEKTKSYLRQHSGTVINEKDHGIADAFNKGIRHATGIAVSFLNSGDVLLDKDYYQQALTILLNNPDVGFVHSDLIFQDMIAGPILLKYKDISLGRGQPFLHPTMVVRNTAFSLIGTFNTKYKIAMDFDHIVRMIKSGIKNRYLPAQVVVMDGTGASTNREWMSIMECLRSLRENEMLGPGNIWGFICRIFYFLCRRSLQRVGAINILKKIKQNKSRD